MLKKAVAIIPILFTLLLIPPSVSAIIPENIPETPDQIDWVLFFVTSKDECNSRNEKALDFYATLTDQYLSKFKTKHKAWAVECISKDVMAEVVNFTTKKFDLVIIIPDSVMSIKDRHTTSSKGHYANWQVHTIVSQALTLYTESRTTGWTLSHELAHFIVSWNGYSWNIVENSVHDIQGKYNDCYDADSTLTHCSYLWETIKTPSGSYFPVMSSDYLETIVNSMSSKETPTYVPSTPKYVPPTPKYSEPSGVNHSEFIKEMSEFTNSKLEFSNLVKEKIYKYERLGFTDSQAKNKVNKVISELKRIDIEILDLNYSKFLTMWNDCHCQQAIDGMAMSNQMLDQAISKVKSLYHQDIQDARNLQGIADVNASNKQKEKQRLADKIDAERMAKENAERERRDLERSIQHQEYLKKKADQDKQKYLTSISIVQQNKYQEHEKLQRGVDESYASLKGISGKSKLEQDRIDKAWDLIKDSKTKLLKLKQNYKNGDNELSKGSAYAGNAHGWYLADQTSPGKIGENLIQISSLIEDVKTNQVYADNNQSQTCFLMWCW